MTEFDFFEKGYYITKIPDDIQSELWRLVYTTEWVEKTNTTHLQYKTEYVKVPSWHPEIVMNSSKPYEGDPYFGSKDPKHHPIELSNIAYKLLDGNILNSYRTLKLKYLTMWNGSGNLDWHSDINDGTDILVLLYLTEEQEWNNYWGGTIEFRKESDSKYYKLVQPLNGTMLIVNSTNPLMQHKVTPMLNRNVNRYTFNFCYSWT